MPKPMTAIFALSKFPYNNEMFKLYSVQTFNQHFHWYVILTEDNYVSDVEFVVKFHIFEWNEC